MTDNQSDGVIGEDWILHRLAPYADQLGAILSKERAHDDSSWALFGPSLTAEALDVISLLNVVRVCLGMGDSPPVLLRYGPEVVSTGLTAEQARKHLRSTYEDPSIVWEEGDFDCIYVPSDDRSDRVNPEAIRRAYRESEEFRLSAQLVTYSYPLAEVTLDTLSEFAFQGGVRLTSAGHSVDRAARIFHKWQKLYY